MRDVSVDLAFTYPAFEFELTVHALEAYLRPLRKCIASQRMAAGQRERALAGFYAWLDGGGREMLSRLAKRRYERQRWLSVIQS